MPKRSEHFIESAAVVATHRERNGVASWGEGGPKKVEQPEIKPSIDNWHRSAFKVGLGEVLKTGKHLGDRDWLPDHPVLSPLRVVGKPNHCVGGVLSMEQLELGIVDNRALFAGHDLVSKGVPAEL